MPPNRNLLRMLEAADEADQVAFTRHLCEKVLDSEPDHSPTLIRYACCLIEIALYDQASSVLEHAEAVVPDGHRHLVFAQRGHRLEHMGDYSDSEEQHLMAHELDPNDATYLIYAASVAFRRGDIQRAEDLALKAVDCPEGCIDEAHFNLGGYLLAHKRYEEARDCYLKALEIDSDYSIAKDRLSDVERILNEVGDRDRDAPHGAPPPPTPPLVRVPSSPWRASPWHAVSGGSNFAKAT